MFIQTLYILTTCFALLLNGYTEAMSCPCLLYCSLCQVVHSLLVFDVIDHLVERFAEKDIELLLVILKSRFEQLVPL